MQNNKINRAIIIAAGFGSRLIPITLERPKPLVYVNGKMIIETLLDALIGADIKEIYIIRGYKKEMFDILLKKYPNLKFIDNPYYEKCNNISSIYVAREYLDQNTYICEADLFLSNNDLIKKELTKSNYLGIKVQKTDDWALLTNNLDITGVSIGGKDCYQMVGISFWNKEDAKQLQMDIKKYFVDENLTNLYWDEVPLKYAKSNYKLNVRECKISDIIEIDTYNELKAIDSSYK